MSTQSIDPTGLAPELIAAREEVRHFTERLPSENFFAEIANFLALSLQVEYVLIGRVTGHKPETILTVAQSFHGHATKPVEYELKDTPCENVVGRNLCYYPSNVTQLFEKDKMLADLRIQSYLGIPLNGSKGQPLGLISVMSKLPINNAAMVEQVLEEVKPRCELELEALVNKLKKEEKTAV